MRCIVGRVLTESSVRQADLTKALGVHRSVFRRQYTHFEEEMPIDLSDMLILARAPATAEFAKRLLLELLAELDTHQLRAVDLDRMAESPFPEQRELVIRILRPLAIKLGLVPSFTVSTADVTSA
jgi:glutamine amidotransferase PdxT